MEQYMKFKVKNSTNDVDAILVEKKNNKFYITSIDVNDEALDLRVSSAINFVDAVIEIIEDEGRKLKLIDCKKI